MPAPSDFPDFATDATYSSGVHSGQPNKIAPTAGLSAQGYYPGKAPGPQPFNWWRNLVGLWVRYFHEEKIPEIEDRLDAYDGLNLNARINTLDGRVDGHDGELALLASSTVVPTYSDLVNVSAITGSSSLAARRTRDYVMATGTFTVTNSGSGLKYVSFTLPYMQGNFNFAIDASGVGVYLFDVTEVFQCCQIYAEVGTQKATIRWWSSSASGNTTINYTMGYYIGTP